MESEDDNADLVYIGWHNAVNSADFCLWEKFIVFSVWNEIIKMNSAIMCVYVNNMYQE